MSSHKHQTLDEAVGVEEAVVEAAKAAPVMERGEARAARAVAYLRRCWAAAVAGEES